jgi:hypothetical protein
MSNSNSNGSNASSIASSNTNIPDDLNNDFSNLVDDFINKLPSTDDADGVITDDVDKAKVIQLYNLLFNGQGAVDDFSEDVKDIVRNILSLLNLHSEKKEGFKEIFKDIGENADVVFEGQGGGRRKTRRHRRRHSSRRVRKVRRAATHRRRHRRRGRKTRRHH